MENGGRAHFFGFAATTAVHTTTSCHRAEMAGDMAGETMSLLCLAFEKAAFNDNRRDSIDIVALRDKFDKIIVGYAHQRKHLSPAWKMAPGVNMRGGPGYRKCLVCSAEADRKCGGCHAVYFCSDACVLDGNGHYTGRKRSECHALSAFAKAGRDVKEAVADGTGPFLDALEKHADIATRVAKISHARQRMFGGRLFRIFGDMFLMYVLDAYAARTLPVTRRPDLDEAYVIALMGETGNHVFHVSGFMCADGRSVEIYSLALKSADLRAPDAVPVAWEAALLGSFEQHILCAIGTCADWHVCCSDEDYDDKRKVATAAEIRYAGTVARRITASRTAYAAAVAEASSSRRALRTADACARCSDAAHNLCARCHTVSYCGTECQRADWKEHKKVCTKPSGTKR